MAQKAATVVVELTGESAQLVRELLKAERANKRSMDRMAREQKRVADLSTKAFTQLRGAIVGVAAALGVRELSQYADSWQTIQNRLKVVSATTDELRSATDGLFAISQRTRSSFEATAELYSRLARSSQQLGLTQQDLLGVTETINQAVAASGATSTEASAGLIQLAQGLASGALRGDELRSVLEQLPRLALALADGLNVPIGKLRDMGQEGQLTAEAVIRALKDQGPAIAAEFDALVPTVTQSFQTVRNALIKEVGEPLAKALGPAAQVLSETMIQTIGDIRQAGDALSVLGFVGVVAMEGLVTAVQSVAAGILLVERGILETRRAFNVLRGIKPYETIGDQIERTEGQVNRLREAVANLTPQAFHADALRAELAAMERELARLRTLDPTSVVATGALDVEQRINAVNASLKRLGGSIIDVTDTAGAIGKIRAEMEQAAEATDILQARLKGVSADRTSGLADQAREIRASIQEAARGAGVEIDLKAGGITGLAEALDRAGLAEAKGSVEALAGALREAGVSGDELGRVTLGAVITEATRATVAASQFGRAMSGAGADIGKEIERISKALSQVSGSKVRVDIALSGLSRIDGDIAALEERISAMRGAELEVGADAEGAKAELFSLSQQLQILKDTRHEVELGLVVRGLEQTGAALEGAVPERMVMDPGAQDFVIREQLALEAEAYAIANQQRIDQERMVQQTILDDRAAFAEQAIILAADQALREVEARIEAERTAKEALGIPLTAEDELAIREEQGELALDIYRRLERQRTALEASGARQRALLARQENQAKLSAAQSYASAAAVLVHAVAGENKAAALAVIAVQKGLGIAQMIINTEVAAMRAVAELGPIMGPPAAAAIRTMGMASIAMIAATGVAEAVGVLGRGGGGMGGIGAGGIGGGLTEPGGDRRERAESQTAIQIHFHGDVNGWDDYIQQRVIDGIRQAVDDRDVILFGSGSRQAMEVRG